MLLFFIGFISGIWCYRKIMIDDSDPFDKINTAKELKIKYEFLAQYYNKLIPNESIDRTSN
jgi:hypothetical protein